MTYEEFRAAFLLVLGRCDLNGPFIINNEHSLVVELPSGDARNDELLKFLPEAAEIVWELSYQRALYDIYTFIPNPFK
jgi:hypothetical protein